MGWEWIGVNPTGWDERKPPRCKKRDEHKPNDRSEGVMNPMTYSGCQWMGKGGIYLSPPPDLHFVTSRINKNDIQEYSPKRVEYGTLQEIYAWIMKKEIGWGQYDKKNIGKQISPVLPFYREQVKWRPPRNPRQRKIIRKIGLEHDGHVEVATWKATRPLALTR